LYRYDGMSIAEISYHLMGFIVKRLL